jgi:hypothetical protein
VFNRVKDLRADADISPTTLLSLVHSPAASC